MIARIDFPYSYIFSKVNAIVDCIASRIEMGVCENVLYCWISENKKGHDSIWVIVDQLRKSPYFFPAKKTYNSNQYAQLYVV